MIKTTRLLQSDPHTEIHQSFGIIHDPVQEPCDDSSTLDCHWIPIERVSGRLDHCSGNLPTPPAVLQARVLFKNRDDPRRVGNYRVGYSA